MATGDFIGGPVLRDDQGYGIADYVLSLRKQEADERSTALRNMLYGEDIHSRERSAALREARESRIAANEEERQKAARRAEVSRQLPDIFKEIENPTLVGARLGTLGLPYTTRDVRGPAPEAPAEALPAPAPAPRPPEGPIHVPEGIQPLPVEGPQISKEGAEDAAIARTPGTEGGGPFSATDLRANAAAAEAERRRIADSRLPPSASALPLSAAQDFWRQEDERAKQLQDYLNFPAAEAAHTADAQRFSRDTEAYRREQAAYEAQGPQTAFDVSMPGGQNVTLDPRAARESRESSYARNAEGWAAEHRVNAPGEVADVVNRYVDVLRAQVARGMPEEKASQMMDQFIQMDAKTKNAWLMMFEKQGFQADQNQRNRDAAMDRAHVLSGLKEQDPFKYGNLEKGRIGMVNQEIERIQKNFGIPGDRKERVRLMTVLNNETDPIVQRAAVGSILARGLQGEKGALSNKDIERIQGRLGGVLGDMRNWVSIFSSGRMSPQQQQLVMNTVRTVLEESEARYQEARRAYSRGLLGPGSPYRDWGLDRHIANRANEIFGEGAGDEMLGAAGDQEATPLVRPPKARRKNGGAPKPSGAPPSSDEVKAILDEYNRRQQ